jgi:hypothetical protein
MSRSQSTIEYLAVVFTVGLLVAVGVLVVAPFLRRLVTRQALRDDAVPIDPHWIEVLGASVPAVGHLSTLERTRLLKMSRELLNTRRWEGCGGLDLTADMRLVIAAQASLLTLEIPAEPYPGLREILVYPSGFLAKRACDPRKWVVSSSAERPVPELGEAWGNGTIVLGWDAAIEGTRDPEDGHNLIIHEFAHQLSFDHHLVPLSASQQLAVAGYAGSATYVEPSHVVTDAEAWRRVLEESYDRLCAKGTAPTILDKYGTTNLDEFFAVASEAFFERPVELLGEDGVLYGQLVALYRQDPSKRMNPSA